jgi:hypothetical protein
MKYRTPGALVLAALLVAALAAPALAQDASVVYLEGDPELRTSGGRTDWLDFGTTLTAGDSVVTGRNDFVELEQGSAATIRVNPDTVFTIREVEEGGQRRQVMSNSTGSVGYRFNRLAGRDEPRIGTSSVVAGIRGTEVVVYAGANGSSLFLVETGLVDVTSAGQTVSLVENEGVEVPAGGPPGEKFSLPDRPIDFSEWNGQKVEDFLRNPAGTVRDTIRVLEEFAVEVNRIEPIYQELAEQLRENRAKLPEMRETMTEEQIEDFASETLRPLQTDTGRAYLNLRYNAISALSLRRYQLGNMYVQMKTRNILNPDDPEYRGFLEAYNDFLGVHREKIEPILEAADY